MGDGLEGVVGMKDCLSTAWGTFVWEKEQPPLRGLPVAVFWGVLFQLRPGEGGSVLEESFCGIWA